MTITDHILSASLDGTIALHASSSASSFSYPVPQEPIPGVSPGSRIRTWPAHPLAWVSLSVPSGSVDPTSEVRNRALVNSIVGTTVLIDITTGETLGKKEIGGKEVGPGTSGGFADPGRLIGG